MKKQYHYQLIVFFLTTLFKLTLNKTISKRKKQFALCFIPISANIDFGNHSLPWAPDSFLISIFMIIRVHIFLVALCMIWLIGQNTLNLLLKMFYQNYFQVFFRILKVQMFLSNFSTKLYLWSRTVLNTLKIIDIVMIL